LSDLTESYLKSSLQPSKPVHTSSLPTPARAAFASSTAAPTFGGAFGRPRPSPSPKPTLSASQVPLPPSEPATPVGGDEEDSKDSIKKAFDAFGPRVGGGGGSFARPKPAGRR
jgi:twinfilin-like protein